MTDDSDRKTQDALPLLDLRVVVDELAAVRKRWRQSQQRSMEPGGRELPSREALTQIVEDLRGALFPMRLGPTDLRQENEDYYVGNTLDRVFHALLGQVRLEVGYRLRKPGDDKAAAVDAQAIRIIQDFAQSLPAIRELLDLDVLAAYAGDPAAHSVDEVLLCYPGIQAMIYHRIAHRLYELRVPLLARVIAELSHSQTGIDIHPGAKIGGGFFIDHGTGVVIGETAVIGQRVRIYQAVTLGAKSFPLDDSGAVRKGLPRHPIVNDDVVIYAGAAVLGRVTIGEGATIGGNVWVTHDVEPGDRVTQVSPQHDIRER